MGVFYMELTYELAQPIVTKINNALNYNINIMNLEGIIIASSDLKRINTFHKGALDVVKTKKEKIIYPSDTNKMLGTKPGVNLPIYIHGRCIGAVGITGNPDDVYNIASILKLATEALIQQKYLSDKLRFKRDAIKEWFLDLIRNDQIEEAELIERARLLNIDIEKRCSIILIKILELSDNNTNLGAKSSIIDGVIDFLSINARSIFNVHLGNDLFIFACPTMKVDSYNEARSAAVQVKDFLTKRKLSSFIAIGNAYSSIMGFRKSYFEAEHSLRLIEKYRGNNPIMHIYDWGIIRILDTIPVNARKSFINQYIGGKPPLGEELRLTLSYFFQYNMDMAKTARALHLHRNTLVYRLEKIKDLLNLDPRQFNDAVILKFILFFQDEV
jgi:carbohydrate diacid regulator